MFCNIIIAELVSAWARGGDKMKMNRMMYPNWEKFSETNEDTFYSRRIRTLLIEDGAISPEEDAFMSGYEEESFWEMDSSEEAI